MDAEIRVEKKKRVQSLCSQAPLLHRSVCVCVHMLKKLTGTTSSSSSSLAIESGHCGMILLLTASIAAHNPTTTTVMLGSSSSSLLRRHRTPHHHYYPHLHHNLQQRRTYYHKIPKDFVPEGCTTSRFMSSVDPRQRALVWKEYALAPTFGSRIACCAIGGLWERLMSTLSSGGEVTQQQQWRKQTNEKIVSTLEDLLEFKPGTIQIGNLQKLSHQMLYKPKSPNAPRKHKRTGEVVASALIQVYLPQDLEDFEDHVTVGQLICEAVAKGGLLKDCGISYAEQEIQSGHPPSYMGTSFTDRMLGMDISVDEAMRIESRWLDRMDEMSFWTDSSSSGGPPPGEANDMMDDEATGAGKEADMISANSSPPLLD